MAGYPAVKSWSICCYLLESWEYLHDTIPKVVDVSWCSLRWRCAAEAAAGGCCCHWKGSKKKHHSKVLAPEWVSQSSGKFSVLAILMYTGLGSCRRAIALITQPLFSQCLLLRIAAFSSPNALLAISGHHFSFQVHLGLCFSVWRSRDWILASSYHWRSCCRRKWADGFGAVLQEDSWAVIWCGSITVLHLSVKIGASHNQNLEASGWFTACLSKFCQRLSGGCLTLTHSSMSISQFLHDGALIAAVPLELIIDSWWPQRSCWSFSCLPVGRSCAGKAFISFEMGAAFFLASACLGLCLCLGVALTSRALGRYSPYSIPFLKFNKLCGYKIGLFVIFFPAQLT